MKKRLCLLMIAALAVLMLSGCDRSSVIAFLNAVRETATQNHTHSYTAQTTPPTCTAGGYTRMVCACGESYITREQPPLGHDAGDGTACLRCGAPVSAAEEDIHTHQYTVVTHQPTCKKDGYLAYTCSECGDYYTEPGDPALGHNYSTQTIPPTPYGEGYSMHFCMRCGDVYRDHYVPALHQHSYTDTLTSPTCTSKGFTTHTCACGYSFQDSVTEALGHSYTGTVVPPSGGQSGYTLNLCSRCGDSFKTIYDDQQDHTHDFVPNDIPATCTQAAYVRYVCSTCGVAFAQQVGDALGHSFTVQVISPTQFTQGFTHHVCLRCGHSYQDNYTGPLPAEEEAEIPEEG